MVAHALLVLVRTPHGLISMPFLLVPVNIDGREVAALRVEIVRRIQIDAWWHRGQLCLQL